LRWSGRVPLVWRILAVNILPIGLLAGSFFYLDGFRARLIEERLAQAVGEASLISESIGLESKARWPQLVSRLGRDGQVRIRIVDPQGTVLADNWTGVRSAFPVPDPASEPLRRQMARRLDEFIDWLVDAQVPPTFQRQEGRLNPATEGATLSLAPDRTHMIEARAKMQHMPGYQIVILRNARDIRRFVRAERSNIGYVIGIAALISVLLSLFLARTIVKPLQSLAEAAQAVRFGQAREVQVPRLPSRTDEIGGLARAVSDMSHALRTRMDAIEAFAADVAHELKNPLASMASAVQSLRTVKTAEPRTQLEAIIEDDVRRMDRLITDISNLSRLDAHIAWTRFERFDFGQLVEQIVTNRANRQLNSTVKLAFARPEAGSTLINGDPAHLSRVVENLLNNAISFTPPKGVVRVAVTRTAETVLMSVDDDGPGVPASAKEAIFERFHSDRPETEFGHHSGLGLSIARTIVEAHSGTIRVAPQSETGVGARFIVEFPLAID
jgi:two-component system, OmpR family, sensor histidine kinase ChvG